MLPGKEWIPSLALWSTASISDQNGSPVLVRAAAKVHFLWNPMDARFGVGGLGRHHGYVALQLPFRLPYLSGTNTLSPAPCYFFADTCAQKTTLNSVNVLELLRMSSPGLSKRAFWFCCRKLQLGKNIAQCAKNGSPGVFWL